MKSTMTNAVTYWGFDRGNRGHEIKVEFEYDKYYETCVLKTYLHHSGIAKTEAEIPAVADVREQKDDGTWFWEHNREIFNREESEVAARSEAELIENLDAQRKIESDFSVEMSYQQACKERRQGIY